MKYSVILCLLFITSFFSVHAQDETFSLTVEISGIKKNKGKVFLALADNAKDFLKKTNKTLGKTSTFKDGKAFIHFKNLKKGNYAAYSYHDENNNGKIDTKMFGIPSEPYGFSNKAKGFMGPPSFKEATFLLNTNTTIKIELN